MKLFDNWRFQVDGKIKKEFELVKKIGSRFEIDKKVVKSWSCLKIGDFW